MNHPADPHHGSESLSEPGCEPGPEPGPEPGQPGVTAPSEHSATPRSELGEGRSHDAENPNPQEGSERYGSLAPMSSPIVSVGGEEPPSKRAPVTSSLPVPNVAPEFDPKPRESGMPSGRKLAPPPKPKSQSIAPQAVNPQAVNPQAVNPQAVNPQAVNPQAVNPQPVTIEPVTAQPATAQSPAAQASQARGVDQPGGRIYFPPPSALPKATDVRSSSGPPSMGSMRPAAPPKLNSSVPPAPPVPAAGAPGVDGVADPTAFGTAPSVAASSVAPPPMIPAAPKNPSFPVPRPAAALRTSSAPPPTLPSGTSPSRYPWMSNATAALAEGNLPHAMASNPTASVATTDTPSSLTSSSPTNTGSVEPPPKSSPSSAPRAAVLPRATRSDMPRRSSTPPPKPRLVPPRPQKETPSIAIEAMRIIAIGTEEQLSVKPVPRDPAAMPRVSVADTSEAGAAGAAEAGAADVGTPDVGTTGSDQALAHKTPGRILASEAQAAQEAGSIEDRITLESAEPAPVENRITPETAEPGGALEDQEIPEIDASPESVRESVEADTAARRPPPPRRRVSLPSSLSEPSITVGEASESESKLAVAEAYAGDDAVEEPEIVVSVVAADATADTATDAEESIESVETVEPVQAKAAAPPPPSRVPRAVPSVPVKADANGDAKPEAPDAPEPSSAGPSEKPRARPRRPWWEELFNEDFSRALVRLTEEQVEQEVNFIEESLGVAPGAVVLDLGCGSGEHAVELAGRGYGIVGYDLSLHQLALAQEGAQERGQKLNFLQGDMREMAFEEVFDGVYCWNTTFGYFEEDKNTNVAERIFRSLKPGGTLLLDVINRDFAAMDQPSSVWYEGDSCVCMDDMSIDFLTSRMRVKRSLILDDGRTRECTYSVRLYSLHELGKMLHDIGFRVTEASGHPTTPGVFLGQSSPHIIILAQKP